MCQVWNLILIQDNTIMKKVHEMVHIFNLYVAGKTSASKRAIDNLDNIFKAWPKDSYNLNVFDVMENPEIAQKDNIMATPLLEKKSPPPSRRIVGDFKDGVKVLIGLGISTEDIGEG